MPHSTADEVVPTPPQDGPEDTELPDAPLLDGENDHEVTQKSHQSDVRLEDLFNDEDSDDDEFTGSSDPNGQNGNSSPPAPV